MKKFNEQLTLMMVLKEKTELLQWEMAEEGFPENKENKSKN